MMARKATATTDWVETEESPSAESATRELAVLVWDDENGALNVKVDFPKSLRKYRATFLQSLHASILELGANEEDDYDSNMGNAARDLNALADDLGYTSFEQAKRVLERGAPKTARDDDTARAKGKPHPETAAPAAPLPAAAPTEPQPVETETIPAEAREQAAPRHPLSPLPEGLSWPVDYDQAPEFNKWRGLQTYLRRWQPLIAAKLIDMPTMREHWPAAAEAIDRQRRKLPPELLPPTLPEVNDRALEGERPIRPEEVARLGAALGRRKAKEWRRITR